MTFTTIFLPTNEAYKAPNIDGCDRAKQALLMREMAHNYYSPTMTVEAKWDCLMDKFIAGVPESHREKFRNFKQHRKGVERNNRNVMQLEQALAYFEYFYFFYVDSDSEHQLTVSQKNQLLRDILSGMDQNVCEPGKITQFENALQSARKDNNWIVNELYQQRRNIIQEIADEYNAKNNVGESFSIHTVMHVAKLAKEQALGVKPDGEINDAYLNFIDTKAITHYFNQAVESKFEHYQRQMVDNLSNHVMVELTQCLQSMDIDLAHWNEQRISLSSENQQKPTELLQKLLNSTLHQLGEDSEDEDSFDFDIYNKSLCYNKIKQLVEQKLVDDGFIISLDSIEIAHLSSYNIRLPNNISLNALLDLKEALDAEVGDFYALAKMVKANQALLIKYPSLLIKVLIAKPQFWYFLPKELKNNPLVIDACIAELNHALKTTIADPESEFDKQKLIDCLWVISKDNTDYLNGLSDELIADKSIARSLICKQGSLLKYLPDALRGDEDIKQAAIAKDQRALAYSESNRKELVDNFYNINSSLPYNCFLTIHRYDSNKAIIAKIEKIQSILELTKPQLITTGQLIRLGQCLTSDELIDVVNYRKRQDLSPLPNCDIDHLKTFKNSIKHDLWKDNGYLALKRQIANSFSTGNKATFLSKEYKEAIAQECIAQSNQWLLAFMAFQKKLPSYNASFKSFNDLLTQLNLSVKAFATLIESMASFAYHQGKRLLIAFGIYAICTIISEAFWQLTDLAYEFLKANFGLLLPAVVQTLILAYQIGSIFNLGKKSMGIIAGIIGLIALLTPGTVVYAALAVELFTLIKLTLKTLIKVGSYITGHRLSWSEVNTLFAVAFAIYIFADANLFIKLFDVGIQLLKNVFYTWPSLLIASILPWFTKTLATIFNHPSVNPSKEELLKRDVENSILRLTDSNQPSAVQKGELLNGLWEKVIKEVEKPGANISYAQALNKKFTIEVNGKEQSLSFWEVSQTKRVDELSFTAKAPDARFSFFGLRGKTTTVNSLKKYVDESHAMALDDEAREDLPQALAV